MYERTKSFPREENMKFYPLLDQAGRDLPSAESLTDEYKSSREIGSIRVGEKHLFFRVRLKVYYIPYSAIRRCYRRVIQFPARMCCGRGEMSTENLVLWTDEGEVAQIPLPSTRAAKELMRILPSRIPGAVFTAPVAKPEEKEKAI